MFVVKPLAKNRPTPVPFPFSDLNSTVRYITTNSPHYVVNDSMVMFVRLNSTQEKTVMLPAGVDGRLIIVQDLGGNSAANPCTIKCTDNAFSGGVTERVFTSGPFVIAFKFNGVAYDVVAQRNQWNTEYLMIGEQPNILPDRNGDTVVESIDGDMLILLGNPNTREVVISKPSIEATETMYPEQYFTVIDGAGTAGTYPITIRFDGTRLNGNDSIIMTGNGSQVTFRSLPDGTYQYILSSGATFSGFDVDITEKAFGFVSVANPFYNTATRGFTNLDGNVGGTFLSNGV